MLYISEDGIVSKWKVCWNFGDERCCDERNIGVALEEEVDGDGLIKQNNREEIYHSYRG
jgi:hypothetical protein